MKASSVLKFLSLLFLFIFIFLPEIYAQVETVPVGNPVYPFLKRMYIQGILKNYDDVVLPLSQKQVIKDLAEIDSNKTLLNSVDKEFLKRMEEKLGMNSKKPAINIFNNFPSQFYNNLLVDKEKHLYFYKDSSIKFIVDPVLNFKYIYSSRFKNNSTLLDIGGTLRGDYDGWFGFYLSGTDGTQFGDRDVARLDPRVEQSFTFNNTKINFFDGTSGYARFQKGILSLELGRERVLWGTGFINKMVLSDNPQLFDFVKFDIAYKKLRYDFLHGWLVQPTTSTYVDSLVGNVKSEQPKYVAISRLGYQATNRLSFGITQMIIYSNRPLEAAYLNPFLFWESAQRSMNDLDNSFLTFDGRYLITNGMELSSSIIFDDINFGRLFKGEWAASNNSTEWQAGTMITSPLLPEDFTLIIEYMQARPYIFSHPGIGEALTYTNNGYLLGTNMQPNSTRLSARLTYQATARLSFQVDYSHTLHGNNIYDSKGNLIRNVGGNVFENYALGDPFYSYLLDGNREILDDLKITMNYELDYGYYLNLVYEFNQNKMNGLANANNIFWCSFNIDFD